MRLQTLSTSNSLRPEQKLNIMYKQWCVQERWEVSEDAVYPFFDSISRWVFRTRVLSSPAAVCVWMILRQFALRYKLCDLWFPGKSQRPLKPAALTEFSAKLVTLDFSSSAQWPLSNIHILHRPIRCLKSTHTTDWRGCCVVYQQQHVTIWPPSQLQAEVVT